MKRAWPLYLTALLLTGCAPEAIPATEIPEADRQPGAVYLFDGEITMKTTDGEVTAREPFLDKAAADFEFTYPHSSVRVTGKGWEPDARISIRTWDAGQQAPVDEASLSYVSPDGTLDITHRMQGVPPGEYLLVIEQTEPIDVAVAPITVKAAG